MTSLTPLKDSNVRDLCRIFHVSRSGYYASLNSLSYMEKKGITHEELAGLFYWIILIRQPHILPKAGWRQLYILCKKHPALQKMGQNRFKEFLRINDLMLEPTRKTHPRTTFTGEGWQKYSDLLNLEDGRFTPSHAGELLVCDITYVPYSIDPESGEQKWCYLSLVTDMYSRAILGYKLSATLETEGPLSALKEALKLLRDKGIRSPKEIIVHSDRGCQYTSKEYTEYAKSQGIRLSMTQCGDPLDNALAERMNGTVKHSTLYDFGTMPLTEVGLHISDIIRVYNTCRPHSSLKSKTPYNILFDNDENPLTEILEEIGYERSDAALRKVKLLHPYIKIRSKKTYKEVTKGVERIDPETIRETLKEGVLKTSATHLLH